MKTITDSVPRKHVPLVNVIFTPRQELIESFIEEELRAKFSARDELTDPILAGELKTLSELYNNMALQYYSVVDADKLVDEVAVRGAAFWKKGYNFMRLVVRIDINSFCQYHGIGINLLLYSVPDKHQEEIVNGYMNINPPQFTGFLDSLQDCIKAK